LGVHRVASREILRKPEISGPGDSGPRGGGDSFASGFIYGLLTTGMRRRRWNTGGHGALAMTTPGDTSMVDKGEVEKLMKGAGARVQR